MKVAVAFLPIGILVAFHNLHFHVDGQQVVARVHAVGRNAFHKKLGWYALAHEAPIKVRKHNQNRRNFATGSLLPQFSKREHAFNSLVYHNDSPELPNLTHTIEGGPSTSQPDCCCSTG